MSFSAFTHGSLAEYQETQPEGLRIKAAPFAYRAIIRHPIDSERVFEFEALVDQV